MRHAIETFLLDMRMATYEHDIEFTLAASEGTALDLNETLSLASEEERQRFLNHDLVYGRPAGAEGLRAAIADMQEVQEVNVDTVLETCLAKSSCADAESFFASPLCRYRPSPGSGTI
jgi:hypothetical protein